MPRSNKSMAGVPCLLYTIMIVLAMASLLSQGAVAATVQYCADFNTGTDYSSVVNIYQSNGACTDNCRQNYAFAVVQGSACWCSNYVPGSTLSGGKCNENCPGYPSEKCGSSTNGAFGYIALNKAPSGTRDGSGSSSSTSASPTNRPGSVTVFQTVTTSPSAASAPATPASSGTPTPSTVTSTVDPTTTSSSDSSTSTKSSMTWTPTPITSVQTITGGLRTVTITPTVPPSAKAGVKKQPGDFFSNAGKVAGLFTGLALLILLTAGLILFCCWRRRLHQSQLSGVESTVGGSTPRPQSRSMSQLGLMNEDRAKNVPRISTGMWAGADASGDSPTSTEREQRRGSRAKVVDQRLDPTALWNPLNDNSSRVSVRSLQDDRDYSRRVLKLANPDP